MFVENNAYGSMQRLGFTYENLSAWNPRIIMVSATGLGSTGPWKHYRGYGGQFESIYGHMSVIGYPDMDPSGIPGTAPQTRTTTGALT